MLLLACTLAHAESRLVVTTDTPVALWLDSRPVEFVPGTFRAVADDLAAGTHALVVASPTGKLLYAGDLTVPDHAEARTRWKAGRFGVVETVPLPVAQALVIETTGRAAGWAPPGLDVQVRDDGMSVRVGGLALALGAPAVPAAPPAPVVPVVVEFSSIDGEWANIRVDGELVAEFRNGSSRRVSVMLDPGPHTVEVRDFMDNAVWAKGVLTVGGPGTIKVGIAEEKAPEVYNNPGAWR